MKYWVFEEQQLTEAIDEYVDESEDISIDESKRFHSLLTNFFSSNPVRKRKMIKGDEK